MYKGCVSDVQLYISLRHYDYHGFKKYACARGTSGLEGLHSHNVKAIAGCAIHLYLFDLLMPYSDGILTELLRFQTLRFMVII